ncbi:hypothetical protein AHF37_01352 [Paragonimus kellicotti]|nr:hypothetical protein AHF37_01352 [Paragonimus kellicotti]
MADHCRSIHSARVACFPGNAYIINRLASRPITSLEEEIHFWFQTEQSDANLFYAGSTNQWLSIYLNDGMPTVSMQLLDAESDSSPVPHSLLRPDVIYSWISMVNPAQVIQLQLRLTPGGQEDQRLDDNQWHEVSLVRSSNQATFKGDGIRMDLLKYTEVGKHGFKIATGIPSSTVNEKSSTTITFNGPCFAHSRISRTDKSIDFTSRHVQESYLRLLLPPIWTTDDLEDSRLMSEHILNWSTLQLHFRPKKMENCLLFLLCGHRMNAEFQPIIHLTVNRTLPEDTGQSKSRLLAAELRNHSLYVVVHRDQNEWIDIKIADYSSNETFKHTFSLFLEVAYKMVVTNQTGNYIQWPLIRSRILPNEEWLYVGPVPGLTNLFGIMPTDVAAKVLKQSVIGREVENAFWFGRNLFIGGMNFTQVFEEGIHISGIHALDGFHSSFLGCVLNVSFNQISLDMQSAVRARQHSRTRVEFDRVIQPKCGSVNEIGEHSMDCGMSVDNQTFGLLRANQTIFRCLNNGICIHKPRKSQCDCSGTMYTGVRCQQPALIMAFNGRQLVHFHFPTTQLSGVDVIQFSFRTIQTQVILLHTYAELVRSSAVNFIEQIQHTDAPKFSLLLSRLYRNYSTGFELSLTLGQLSLRHYSGSSESVIKLEKFVADGQWHTFKLFRTGIHLMIEIDGEKHPRSIHLRSSYLSTSGFVIGSTRYSPASNSPVTLFNFVGEIKHFLFNDVDLTSVPWTARDDVTNDMSLSKQTQSQGMNWLVEMDVQSGDVTELAAAYEPAYPFQLTGNTCSAEYSRIGQTVSWLPVRFAFRTSTNTCVLFLGMNNDGQKAILVGLDQGKLKLMYLNEGRPSDSATIEQRLDDDRWHVVHVSSQGLNQKTIILELDKMITRSKRGLVRIQPGIMQWNGFRAYFGRIPMHMFPAWNSLKQTYRNFRGCFGDISFADEPPVDFVHVALQPVNVNGSVDSRCASTILPGCANDSRPSCGASQTNRERDWLTAETNNRLCRNGGRCVRVGRSLVCDCQETTFRGQHCTLGKQE